MCAFIKCFCVAGKILGNPATLLNRSQGDAAISLEAQIKRHVIAQRHRCFAVTAPGVEAVCALELSLLSDTIEIDPVPVKGGVSFSGRLEDIYRANLHVRTAGRLLMRLTDFNATNFRQLEKKCAALAWQRYLPQGAVPLCKVAAHRSRLYHTGAISGAVTNALSLYWQQRAVAPAGDCGQTLFVRIENDTVVLSLDSSGPNLYRRGLKMHGGRAPLRETLAAAILLKAGYDPTRPLLDPMCGAGTFALEAALIAKRIAPGSRRDFAFTRWPAFSQPQWRHHQTTALQKERCLAHPMIFASDLDPDVCRRLETCVRDNALTDVVAVRSLDFFKLTCDPGRHDPGPGLIVLNPPYGRRLALEKDVYPFYSRIGTQLHEQFKGWQVAMLVPDPALIRTLPFTLRSSEMVHGGLPLTLLVGRIG
jgi:putative N6-adenine-specific DNA methylase